MPQPSLKPFGFPRSPCVKCCSLRMNVGFFGYSPTKISKQPGRLLCVRCKILAGRSVGRSVRCTDEAQLSLELGLLCFSSAFMSIPLPPLRHPCSLPCFNGNAARTHSFVFFLQAATRNWVLTATAAAAAALPTMFLYRALIYFLYSLGSKSLYFPVICKNTKQNAILHSSCDGSFFSYADLRRVAVQMFPSHFQVG